MVAVNRNRIRSLFIFIINQLLTINDPKFSEIFRNFSEFLYSGLFSYITIKLNLTFISQQKLEY